MGHYNNQLMSKIKLCNRWTRSFRRQINTRSFTTKERPRNSETMDNRSILISPDNSTLMKLKTYAEKRNRWLKKKRPNNHWYNPYNHICKRDKWSLTTWNQKWVNNYRVWKSSRNSLPSVWKFWNLSMKIKIALCQIATNTKQRRIQRLSKKSDCNSSCFRIRASRYYAIHNRINPGPGEVPA